MDSLNILLVILVMFGLGILIAYINTANHIMAIGTGIMWLIMFMMYIDLKDKATS